MTSHRIHYFHLIWSTKHRKNLILPHFKYDLYNYMGGVIKNSGGHLISIGGTANHVHLLIECVNLDRFTSIIRTTKASSTFWVKEKYPNCEFGWQDGYGSYSVSFSIVDQVCEYIKNQEEHHKKFSFEEEYMKFLNACRAKYNPKYVFESEEEVNTEENSCRGFAT